jgi:hypothetical protein
MASVTALGALAVLLENGDGGTAAQVKPTLDPTSPFNDAGLDGWRVMPEAHATQRIAMRPMGVVDGDDALEVGVVTRSVLLFTVTFYANLAHSLTRSP